MIVTKKRRNFDRQKVFEQQGTVCTKCGSDKRIVIHHKNCDKSNNTLNNALVLCSVCHGKLHQHLITTERWQEEIQYARSLNDPEHLQHVEYIARCQGVILE